jgi:predicted nucleic acid-binding Zn ribbon protein
MIKKRKCVVCGECKYGTERFKTCSNKCRQKLYRQRVKQDNKKDVDNGD